MVRTENRGLTSSDLKWIALALMVLDHIHYFFDFTGYVPVWFSMAGRLSAPLFLFCLAEGFSHTHDRKRYFMKVYLISILMSGLLFLMMCGLLVRPDGFFPLNGMMSAFVVLMAVWQGFDWLGEKKLARGLAAVILPLAWPVCASLLIRGVPALQVPLAVLGYTLLPMWNGNADNSIPVIITGILLYLFRRNRKVQAGAFICFTLLYFVGYVGMMASRLPDFHWTQMFTMYYEWYSVFAAPLMLCYNGRRGQGPKAFFYVFYPVHIYGLYALSWLALAWAG